jgi:hypothetical protein
MELQTAKVMHKLKRIEGAPKRMKCSVRILCYSVVWRLILDLHTMQTSEGAPTSTTLPSEVLLHIFEFLDAASITHAVQVCKQEF